MTEGVVEFVDPKTLIAGSALDSDDPKRAEARKPCVSTGTDHPWQGDVGGGRTWKSPSSRTAPILSPVNIPPAHSDNVTATDLATLLTWRRSSVTCHARHCLTDHINCRRSNNVHPRSR